MICWLKGEKIQRWELGARSGLVLACGGVGYEVQMSKRNLNKVEIGKEISLWVHQLQREDGYSLFGFTDQKERDIFRKLISVSGVGPQLAMSLHEDNESDELISTIINKDIKALTRSSGIGKRTAERLVIDLQNKLTEFNIKDNSSSTKINAIETSDCLKEELFNEVKSALTNLDYSDSEIRSALNSVFSNNFIKVNSTQGKSSISQNLDFEQVFKEALITLSQ